MQEVVAAYKDSGDVKQVQSTGLHIAGERFIVIKADDRSIYGKKVSGEILGARGRNMRNSLRVRGRCQGNLLRWDLYADDYWTLQGKEGVVIVKTNMAILVSHYPENVQPGVAANTVEQLADYLIGVGY
jgi:profilin